MMAKWHDRCIWLKRLTHKGLHYFDPIVHFLEDGIDSLQGTQHLNVGSSYRSVTQHRLVEGHRAGEAA